MIPLAVAEPLHLAAHNLHRIPSPAKLVVFALLVWTFGTLLIHLVLRYVTSDPYVAVASGWVVALALLKWRFWAHSQALLWVGVAVSFLVAVYRLRRSGLLDGPFIVLMVVIGAPPLVQLLVNVARAEPIRMPDYTEEISVGEPSRLVEDVLIVVFDELPSPQAARYFLDHDSASTVEDLRAAGFSVPDQAWSAVTTTSAAVPALLALGTLDLVDTVPDGRALARIAGGANPTMEALTRAGYRYTHLEAGWGQSLCYEGIDECLLPPLWDPPTWQLLSATPIGIWLERRYGSPQAYSARRAVEVLGEEAREHVDDGVEDVIFAHVLAPHTPFVLTDDCRPSGRLLDSFPLPEASDSELEMVRSQLRCAELWLKEVAGMAGKKTAMIITADHGTRSRFQMERHPRDWTDLDISERLSAFLAYRFPTGCAQPEVETIAEAMRASLECVFGVDLELPAPRHQVFVSSVDGVSPPVREVARSQLRVPGADAGLVLEG